MRVDPTGPLTPHQADIVAKADDLLDTLDETVPDSTIHYTVEEARQALRVLARQAHRIKTNDAPRTTRGGNGETRP